MLRIPVYNFSDSHSADYVTSRVRWVNISLDRNDRDNTFLKQSLSYILAKVPARLVGVGLNRKAILKTADSISQISTVLTELNVSNVDRRDVDS
jgi:hypothetical protein